MRRRPHHLDGAVPEVVKELILEREAGVRVQPLDAERIPPRHLAANRSKEGDFFRGTLSRKQVSYGVIKKRTYKS